MTSLQLSRAQAAGTSVFSRGYLRELSLQDRLWLLPLTVAGTGVALAMAVFLLLQNYRALLSAGTMTGTDELLFFFSFLASGIFIFILAVPASLSRIFHSRDSALLMILPVTSSRILVSKLLLLYPLFLALHLIFFLPAVFVFHSGMETGPWFFPAVVLQGIAGPLVPLTLGVLAAGLLAGLSTFSRHRVLMELAGMIVLLAALVVLQTALSRQLMEGMTESRIDPESAILRFAGVSLKVLPPAAWAARSLSGPVRYLPLSAAFSAAVTLAGVAVLSRRFQTVLGKIGETPVRAGARRHRSLSSRTGSPTGALLAREWAVLSSSSVFLFEAVGEALVLPILLLIFSLTIPDEVRTMVIGFLDSIEARGLPVFGALLLFTGINTVSSTSLSREGSCFSLSLSLPVPGKDHLAAKLLFHLAIFAPALIIDIIILSILLKLPAVSLVYLLPGGFASIFMIFALTVAVDLRNPMLTWKHPQQAMKQNLNTLTGLGLSFASLTVTLAAGAGLYVTGLPEIAVGLLVTVLLSGGAWVFYKRAARLAEHAYSGGIEIL